jgi:hypothetical protein
MSALLPDDPRVAYEGGQPLVGCSRVLCGECGKVVRHVDQRRVPSPHASKQLVEALFDAEHPEELPTLLAKPSADLHRAYFCRCTWVDTQGAIWLRYSDVPWACGGHPE